jgi:aminoglycoside phosphotransferase (APT) family kinase protein
VTDLEPALQAFLRDELSSSDLVVTGVSRLSGGASRETFGVALEGYDRGRAVLQRVRPGPLSATFSMVGEASLLRAARHRAVPVPEVLAACDDPSVLGTPFVVSEWVDGETIARRILRDDEFSEARRWLVAQSAEALAGIHAVPLEEAPTLAPPTDALEQTRAMFDDLGEAHPAFELGFRWLADHRPPPSADSDRVVHGDFRLGNLMVDADGLAAVLDWELSHRGDPMEDLGWFCVKAWRFGAEPPVAGLGRYEELFAAYEQASGRPVDREVAHWWEVLGTLRWGVICILQASTHLTGASRSVELAAIGRRVCENEYDLLELLP